MGILERQGRKGYFTEPVLDNFRVADPELMAFAVRT